MSRGVHEPGHRRSARVRGLLLAGLCSAAMALPTASRADPEISELQCGGQQVRMVSDCRKPDAGPFPECRRQEITLGEGKTQKRVVFAPPKGKSLAFVAASWACAKGKDADYLLVSFYNGGNCAGCETLEIIDLNGRRLSPEGRGSKNVYKTKGLPKALPTLANIDLP